MKDEIKEILNKWKCYIELTKKFTTNEYEMLRVEDINKILDYITNLQERCEYLERSNNRREDEIMSLRDECVDGETYKSRNEKAIEYINHEIFKRTILVGVGTKKYTRNILDNVLNILQGEDKDE